jgi:DNA-binding transcriptional LysR family regulator
MEWDDLKTFLAISREGTLSAAARSLGVTQTTVGRRLDALHKRAGVRLLQKTPSGYVLTPAGEHILANVQTMEAEALAVELAVTGDDVRLGGIVRVTMVSLIATKVIAPTLADFHARYPDIVIEINVDPHPLNLARREADIALRIGKFDQNDVIVRKVGEFTMSVFAAPDYLAKYGTPDFTNGAPGHRKVTAGVDFMSGSTFGWFEGLTSRATVTLRANMEVQIEACREGLGLGCLPDYVAEDMPGLVKVDAPAAPPRELWLGVHRDLHGAPRIRAVLDHITATMRKVAPIGSPWTEVS